jgi:hypothetical protein
MELTLNLKPKTNIKAALRSLFIPGWGQMYSGRKGIGMIFSLLAAGATGYYIITDNNFYDKLDEYVRINSQYASAMTDADRISLYPRIVAAKQNAYDAENKRFRALAGIITVWGLNLLDALIFFPKQKDNPPVSGLTIKPDPVQGGAQIVYSHRF